MEWWRKASYQNDVKEVISYHHSQKKKNDFRYKFMCSQSDSGLVSYLAKSRTKSYYLYIYKTLH